MSKSFLLLSLLAVILGCKPKQSTTTEPKVTVPPLTETQCAPVSRGVPPHKDPLFDVKGVLSEDCLEMKYNYTGGCQEHDVQVYWSGSWAETIPPGTHLYVSHNANGDACKSIQSGLSKFDLKPLRYEGVGQVVIDLHAEGLPMVRLNYVYKP